jgi:hypothetical protein
LSRSPHTRNVFVRLSSPFLLELRLFFSHPQAKTLARETSFSSPGAAFSAATNSFSSFASEPRLQPQPSQALNLSTLSRWTRKLGELVDVCQTALEEAKPATPEPVDDGSTLEIAMLEQERDLLAADFEALKAEVAVVRRILSFLTLVRDVLTFNNVYSSSTRKSKLAMPSPPRRKRTPNICKSTPRCVRRRRRCLLFVTLLLL